MQVDETTAESSFKRRDKAEFKKGAKPEAAPHAANNIKKSIELELKKQVSLRVKQMEDVIYEEQEREEDDDLNDRTESVHVGLGVFKKERDNGILIRDMELSIDGDYF